MNGIIAPMNRPTSTNGLESSKLASIPILVPEAQAEPGGWFDYSGAFVRGQSAALANRRSAGKRAEQE